MPDKKTAQGTELTTPATAPTRYSIARLRQDCHKLFAVTPSTFDGAVYGIREKKFTIEEMAAHIQKWQRQPLTSAQKIEEEGP